LIEDRFSCPIRVFFEGRGIIIYKRVALRVLQLANAFGIDLLKLCRAVAGIPIFLKTFLVYRKASRGSRFPIRGRHLRPILNEIHGQAGQASGHYFHQDLWAARKIFAAQPTKHIDIGSRIDGFVAHLLVFMPVEVIDIRPLANKLPGLTFIQEDATTLARFKDDSIESISSLHAIEHFGLGRYGDSVDPDACFRAMRSLARVLSPGGRLYFSVPIGIERVEFNAHRVFSPQTILETFNDLILLSFAAVDGKGEFHSAASPEEFANSEYSCGLYEFTKSAHGYKY